MTSAWFLGASTGVPQDQSVVRSTLEPVRTPSDETELQAPPEFNQFDTDDTPELTGLSRRDVQSDSRETEKYAPGLVARYENLNANTDNQVASSGTAAKREMAGQQGHGTMQFQIGIEPIIREGVQFGNDYFVVDDKGIQEGAGAYMLPVSNDQWGVAVANARAGNASREAAQATLYAQFLGA